MSTPDTTPVALTLGDAALTLERLDSCLDRPVRVTISPRARERVARGRAWVEDILARGAVVYGINTGFGHLKNKRISAHQLDQLQENLLISHAVGVGPPAPAAIVRFMLLLKSHMLLAGHSGVRIDVVERLADWLNADLLPVVPTRGSLGASGDLAPLAHLVLPLLNRGEFSVAADADADAVGLGTRVVRPAADVAAERGVEPVRLAAKEGLALINGTQFCAAYAANLAIRARRLADLADLIYCMSLEGLRGSARPADERLHALRPHAGAQRVAANIRRHLRDSEILASHAGCDRVQDPYSLRCVPQVHGAFRDALAHFCNAVEVEINSVTDNPILFGSGPGIAPGRDAGASDGTVRDTAAPSAGDVAADAISGGNFHAEPLALVLDYLAIALTDLANISERRTYLLLSGEDGLPKLLLRDTGLNSGFMLPQYTAAALLNECKVLSTPASVDSIPTSLGQEDHVSMGATSAVKCYEVLDRVETVLAIEMMCAAQALDFRAPLKPGAGPRAAHAIVRQTITHADADRLFGDDMRAALRLVRASAELRGVARA
ncbi:MAG: histidine ammonia-lyase [Phycisphaerae bacterium]